MTLTGLAVRNLWRNKMRTVLTMVGVAIAIISFVTLRTLVWSWTSAAEFAAKDRVVTRHKVTFVMSLPKRYIDEVRGQSGVKVATYASWFGGKDPKHEKEFFSTLAVDATTYFQVYDEALVEPDALAKWKADRSGAIVGDALAKKMGWNVGDKVTLESGIYANEPDKPWTFTIDGIYTATKKSVDRSTLVFHWDYLNEALPQSRKDQIGWIVTRVNDPSRSVDMGVTIDKIFDVKDIQTLSQDEATFNASFLAGISAILTVIDIVSFIILIIMALVLGNTIAMGVRERTFEYGVLRAMGFLPKQIAFFILGESGFTCLVGGLLGIAISYPMVEKGMGRWLEENVGGFFPYFRIPGSTIGFSVVAALALGLAAAAIPAYSASQLRVTDALRKVV